MTLAARTVLVALVSAGALAAGWGCAGPPHTVEVPKYEPPKREPPGALKHRPVGSAGCLAAACHGGPADKTLARVITGETWQSSGSCWAAADPHTAAYSLLTDNPHRPVKVTAKEIMAKYAPGTLATDDMRCVACHTNPALAATGLPPEKVALRSEGVSCEACHGNAGGWVSGHTTWKGDRRKVCDDTGMTKLFDIGERAMTCAGCHVGAPADEDRGHPVRDMNHDMIAAGHPRLNFDFAEYLRRLPPHWQEKDRTASADPLPTRTLNAAKVWYVGRLAHAEAACRLLEDRANRSMANDERTPWPEFAEFNCAACHHDLRIADANDKHRDWRKSAAHLGDRPPGVAPWQTIWPVSHASGLARPTRLDSRLNEVVMAMERPRPTAPALAKKFAITATTELHTLRNTTVEVADAEAERRAREFFPAGMPLVPEWDTATQFFYGLAALDRTRGKYDPELLKAYEQGVTAFRKQDWPGVEKAFEAIRKPR